MRTAGRADRDVPRSALVIGAHPDDCEFGAGGTTWLWGQSGCEVHFLVVTDGGRGSADTARSQAELVEQRRAEQLRAGEVLGVQGCHFLDYSDGEVENDRGLLKDLVKVIRELRPEVVLTHGADSLDHRPFDRAEGTWINHRDHRAVGQAVLDAVYPYSRNPNSFAELGLEPHKVSRVFLWGKAQPNCIIDVDDGNIRKAKALACHQSQFAAVTDWDRLTQLWGTTEKFEVMELSE